MFSFPNNMPIHFLYFLLYSRSVCTNGHMSVASHPHSLVQNINIFIKYLLTYERDVCVIGARDPCSWDQEQTMH